MPWKKDNPGSPCCSCECPCYPLDGNGRDYHRHLDLFTSGTVAYSTTRHLGTKSATFSGGGYLYQDKHECYSIGNGLRWWCWWKMEGTQATQGQTQNIVTLGGVVSQSSGGAPLSITGGGGLIYYNYSGGIPISTNPNRAVQPSGTGSGVEIIGGPSASFGTWPSVNTWNFAHFTYTSTGTVVHQGTSPLTYTTLRGSVHPDYGTDKLLPVFIGGAPDVRHNAGYNAFGGSTTGTSIVRIDNVGFSTSITNYTAKAASLFNSATGRACPAST